MSEQYVSKAPKLGAQPCLDGVRGFGIFVVVFGHASAASGAFDKLLGFTAVIDGFFVLSGFLITTLLLQEHRKKGSIDFKKFFMRRALRLFPSLWLYCAVWLTIGLVFWVTGAEVHLDGATLTGGEFLMKLGGSVAAAFFYVFHNFFPVGVEMINKQAVAGNPLTPLWTLSIEEQFYIAMPFILYFCLKKNWMKQLMYVTLGMAVAIGIHRAIGYTGPTMTHEGSPAWLRLLWLQRPDALFLGITAAVFNASITEEFFERHRRRFRAAGVAAFGLWIVNLQTSHGVIRDSVSTKLYVEFLPKTLPTSTAGMPMYYYRFAFSFGAILAIVFAFPMVRDKSWWLTKVWSFKPLVMLGRLAYTMYIWHGLAVVAVGLLLPGKHWILQGTVGFVLAVMISIPIFTKFELPILMKRVQFAATNELMDLKTGEMINLDEQNQVVDPAAESVDSTTPPVVSPAEPVDPGAASPS